MSDTPDRDAPSNQYEKDRQRLEDEDDVSDDEYEAIMEFLNACDERISRVTLSGDKHKSPSTLREYCKRLRLTARRLDGDMTEASAEDINRLWDDLSRGDHPDVSSGLSQNTLNAYQGTVRKFYEYHDDLDPEKDDLAMVSPEKSQVDERDVLDTEDIEALRDAVEHPRNQCLLDLLIWTGQRIRALQTLRIKDLDFENGEFYLNDDAEGLKGADGKRALLAAEGSVREWVNKYHPAPDDPEAYVLCHRSDSSRGGDGQRPVTRNVISRVLKDIADRAGVDKPVNPHNFRHTWVTIAKRQYDLDDTTIKGLLGHNLDSTVMERTYAHLKDDDHVKEAQQKMGSRNPKDDDSPLTPSTCPTCDEPLSDGAKACSVCGTMLTPDAQSVQQTAKEDIRDDMVDTEDPQLRELLGKMASEIEDNPELLDALTDEYEDEVN